jgi:hypothetical protein
MTGTDTMKARAGLAKLLRFLSQGAAERRPATEGQVRLRRADGSERTVPAVLLRVSLSRGLMTETAGRIALSDAGRAWLKRLLAAGDDAFAAQHGPREAAVVDVEGEATAVVVNTAESPLATLVRLKDKGGQPFLSERAFLAGERLRADFTRGQLQPRISANWEMAVSDKGRRSAGGGIAELTDAALSARRRVDEALDAVGPELSGVLVDVCCFLKGIEQVERERQWPVRSGKLMLKTALLSLARHYDSLKGGTPRRTHRWGDEGYRPDMAGRFGN